MLSGEDLKKYCELDQKGRNLMETAFTVMKMSARAYYRILRVARTAADLAGEEKIREEHLREAIGYRMVDRKYWGRHTRSRVGSRHDEGREKKQSKIRTLAGGTEDFLQKEMSSSPAHENGRECLLYRRNRDFRNRVLNRNREKYN